MFKSTPWSLVFAAGTQNETRRRDLLDRLIASYWKPVYSYVRKKGYSNDAAKDLTQGFFYEIVLERDLIKNADEAKGRFRTFLIVALEHFLVDAFRHDKRLKRGGKAKVTGLDVMEGEDRELTESPMSPEEAFYYSWIVQLLDLVIAEVKEEYCSTDREGHWEVFRLRLLEPILYKTPPPGLPEICHTVGVKDPATVSNQIETVKRRFRSVLMRHLKDLTCSEVEAANEFQEIFRFLDSLSAR